MNVSKAVQWDILKLRVKEQSIRDGIRLAKASKDEIICLEMELAKLDNKNDSTDSINARRNVIQQRLDELYTEKTRGAMIRAKVDAVNEVENNAKLFHNIEISRQRKQVIECLIGKDGEQIYEQESILKMIGEFYCNLYKSKDVNQKDIDDLLGSVNFDNMLSDEDKRFMDQMPSLNEFDEVVKIPKDNKSPGLDGISIEFYRKFWTQIRDMYFSVIVESWNDKTLPESTRTSVLSTLFKSNNRKYLDNYRPLSLSNCDYRILALLFAKRLETVLHKLVNGDQCAYIKDRFIGSSIRNMIDLYDYCENTHEPGAFICADFMKAFDSLEHNFVISVLHKLNFGEKFISWLSILYNDARFKVKNNGWVSQSYVMSRGLRQGCSMSALIFILVVEVLALMIRQNNNIKGISIGGKQHKIMQYADDTTICVANVESIEECVNIFKRFGMCSGLKLNLIKTKGIWLGALKDLGWRTYQGITFTGNPVKCLGIYIGHNVKRCYQLNWKKKLDTISKCIKQWNKRNVTLFGKVKVIKTYLLAKIVYPASVLSVPSEVVKELKSMLYEYLWGKRDKVKRTTVTNKRCNGGLDMVDVDCFLDALKVAWIPRMLNGVGKWLDPFRYYVNKMGITMDYILKMSVRNSNDFPIIDVLPEFYKDIVIAFNKAKKIKQFDKMSKYEVMQQPLWGNTHFRVGKTCIYFREWVECNFLYVKDLIKQSGVLYSDNELFQIIRNKKDIMKQLYIIKNYICKKLDNVDIEIAQYVKINSLTHILQKNQYIKLVDCKTKDFYQMLVVKNQSRGNMESVHAREFAFSGRDIWCNIYKQKIESVPLPKIAEFNFKLLHNIVPCGLTLNKWQTNISKLCDYCGETETTRHMLYDCNRIKLIWRSMSEVLRFDIRWKHIICGFVGNDLSSKIRCFNMIISILTYGIFKQNSRCKFDRSSYKDVNLKIDIKHSFILYMTLLKKISHDADVLKLFVRLNEQIQQF